MTPSATILNGKEIAAEALDSCARKIQDLKKSGVTLTLATVRAGDPPDAILYSNAIEKISLKTGVHYKPVRLPADTPRSDFYSEIEKLNSDPAITGIMILEPLPKHFNDPNVHLCIDKSKDVESPHLGFVECDVSTPTATACIWLIKKTGLDLTGKDAVVIGRSEIVGKPVAMYLLKLNMTVTFCHSKTIDLPGHVRRADVVIASVGKPNLVKGDWIKPGAIVIDVGENIIDGRPVGDIDFESVKKVAGFISPVPGGVGPITNVVLMHNLLILHNVTHGNS